MELAQKQTDQGNRTVTPELNSHAYGQLIFDTGNKNILERKDSPFSRWYWGSWTSICLSMKLEHPLIPHTKINSSLLNDLNKRHDTKRLLEENIRQNIF